MALALQNLNLTREKYHGQPGALDGGQPALWQQHRLRQLPDQSKLFFSPYELTIESDDAYTGDTAITQLTHAYAITGDERYAHRAAVMLNRLAEVYRFYNGTVDEQRPLTRGYLVQVSWEEWPIHDCLVAYDLIMDVMLKDEPLLNFFKLKGDCDYNEDGEVKAGDRFLVCDLNAGDAFEVMRSAHRVSET